MKKFDPIEMYRVFKYRPGKMIPVLVTFICCLTISVNAQNNEDSIYECFPGMESVGGKKQA